MKGSKPLADSEVEAVSAQLAPRDRALFILGVCSGFRISELLSLRIGNVEQNGRIVDAVAVARRAMKGKNEGRTIPLAEKARIVLADWLNIMRATCPLVPRDTFLFASRKGNGAITRTQAWRVLSIAYTSARISGKLGTHAMRKTFAAKMYEGLGHDLMKTQRALGHRSITSTVSYLSFAESDINAAVLGAWG